jgi:hypothetical protein
MSLLQFPNQNGMFPARGLAKRLFVWDAKELVVDVWGDRKISKSPST